MEDPGSRDAGLLINSRLLHVYPPFKRTIQCLQVYYKLTKLIIKY